MNRDGLRQGVNVVAYMATLIVNTLAVTLPLGKGTTAQIANRYPILFLPANFTFGIWGVIYLALGVFTVYQALPSQRINPVARQIGWLFALTCLFNCTWLLLFQYLLFPLSMLPMLGLLLTLIVIYQRQRIGQEPASLTIRWVFHLPFSLYLGWITVATIANATYVLYAARWDGFGVSGVAWAALLLVVAAALTLVFIVARRDVAYALVVIWALYGIFAKQGATPPVATTAAVLAIALAVALAVRVLLGRARLPGGETRLPVPA